MIISMDYQLAVQASPVVPSIIYMWVFTLGNEAESQMKIKETSFVFSK